MAGPHEKPPEKLTEKDVNDFAHAGVMGLKQKFAPKRFMSFHHNGTKIAVHEERATMIKELLADMGGNNARVHVNPNTLDIHVFKNPEHMAEVFENWRNESSRRPDNHEQVISDIESSILIPKEHINEIMTPGIDLDKMEEILHKAIDKKLE